MDDSNNSKECTRCKKRKDFSEFSVNNAVKSGLAYWCKSCWREHRQIPEVKIARTEYGRVYTSDPVVKGRRNKQQNVIRGTSEFKAAAAENMRQRRKLPEVILREALYRLDADVKKRAKERPRNKEKKAKAERVKYQEDVEFRITKKIRHRRWLAIKAQNADKLGHLRDLLGCGVDELRKHLESKFYDNPETGEPMTWGKYGRDGWHIDEIIPCSAWDLTDATQQKLCFNWSNTQPLWAKDNLFKGGTNRKENVDFYQYLVLAKRGIK